VLPVPDELAFDAAALIEPSTVARHMLDLGRFVPGGSAIVLGAGSIGLMLVQWLRVLGAGLIVATDVVPGISTWHGQSAPPSRSTPLVTTCRARSAG
jgi:threonine dehydrogenase-like Zn-dependent dehydrogenase